MSDVISIKTRTARKAHECNACLFLYESDYRNLGATFSEYRQIADAIKKKGKILPGEVYEEVFVKDSGAVGIFRQKPSIDQICRKYDLYFE